MLPISVCIPAPPHPLRQFPRNCGSRLPPALTNACLCRGALQLVQDFKVLLLLGRRLVFPVKTIAAVRADMTTQAQLQAADGTAVQGSVSLAVQDCRAATGSLA